eukprot:Plantae.Rhodophyta-Purpureofilum_apyrenoidigerum.ctg6767.p1 GENE.Plantae.Rhodophyta-Purpureofilum_apyrenoidigerum.ctg6767~~Plantae.Rhodophyta-Purpureofilum_apyrenoidigerum.ctg6767.p1  ORF type:complete len:883 (+),score=135.07 Plantae.Rhodophyta-Purpureofilum_apyrenoidigerum.ctg6767:376-3024(+)
MNELKLVVTRAQHCRGVIPDGTVANTTVTAAALLRDEMLFGTSDGRVVWCRKSAPIEAKITANPVTGLVVDDRQHKHVLVLTDADGFYVLTPDQSGKKLIAQQLRKFRDQNVFCATWLSTTGEDYSHRSLLIGTEKGQLSLVTLKFSTSMNEIVDQLWATPENRAIVGIYVEQIERNILCAIATGDKMYHRVLKGCTVDAFSEMDEATVFDPPKGVYLRHLGMKSKLVFLGSSRIPVSPRNFVWATASGMLVTGELGVHLKDRENPSTLCSKVDNAFSLQHQLSLEEDIVDLAMSALTIVLQTAHNVVLVSALNGQALKSMRLPYDSISEVARFLLRNEVDFLSISAFGTTIVMEIDSEDANAWKTAADIGRFDLALLLAPTEKRIYELQAAHYEARDDWAAAVKLYAKTSVSIEQILLKIADACKTDLHMAFQLQSDYLGRRLDELPEKNATQRSMVILLLIELYSSKLARLDSPDQETILKEDFRNFLSDHGNDLIAKTAIQIMTSHGRYDEASFFASRIKDLRTAVQIHLNVCNVHKALDIFTTAVSEDTVSAKKRADALSLIAADASAACPMRLAKLWFNDRHNVHLDHHRLVQNLLLSTATSHEKMNTEALQAAQWFLEALVKTPDIDEAEERYWLHALFNVYTTRHNEEYAVALVEENHEKLSSYSLGLMLNTALTKQMVKLAISLYGALDLHENAVDLALKSLDRSGAENHAMKIAVHAKTDSEKRHARKLLLRIAKSQSENFLDLVERSQGFIRIEDVLMTVSASQDDRVDSAVIQALATSLEDHHKATAKVRATADRLLSAVEVIRSRITEATANRDVHSNRILCEESRLHFVCGHSVAASFAGDSCPTCGMHVIESVRKPIRSDMYEDLGFS